MSVLLNSIASNRTTSSLCGRARVTHTHENSEDRYNSFHPLSFTPQILYDGRIFLATATANQQQQQQQVC
jgi:hypothetical protein